MHRSDVNLTADSPGLPGCDEPVGLDDVVITGQLTGRPARPPDYEAESKALAALARELAESPGTILQKLADTALALCGAGSAGVSVLERGDRGEVFRCHAAAGALAALRGRSMPRAASPCGTVLDRNAVQLAAEPARGYPHLRGIDPPVVEALLIPFHRGATPIGTVWIVAHSREKRFDAEDVRLLTGLCQFASAAVQTGEQTRRFDRVLSSITDFAYTFDLDGRFTFVNKPLLDLWGLTLDEAVGKNFFDLRYPDELAAKLQRQIQEVIQTRRRLVDETPYTSPTGAGGYYQYIFSPIIEADGAVHAVAGSTRDISERKRLESERERLARDVEAERAKLAAVIEQAPAFICTLRGPAHVFELANERYYEIVGRRDLIGRPAREAIPEAEGQGFFELLNQVYQTGEPFTGNEMPILLRRGGGGSGAGPGKDVPLERRYVNFVYQPMRDGNGRVHGIFVHGVDVTEMVRARDALREREERLRTSEERLAFALDAAELGTFYCPMPLGKIIWNQTCKEHFWLPPDAEIDFDLFYSIIHPDDREPTRRAVEEAVFGRHPYEVEYRTVAPDGRVRWVRAKGRAYYDAGGNPTRFDGVTLDVTERRRAEEALRESEAAFRQLADAMPQIVWAARADGVIDYYNRRWFEYIDLPAGAIDEATWDRYVHPDDLARVHEAWSAAVRTGQTYATEFRVRRADGAYRWFLVRALPVLDAGGKTTRWFGTCTDIDDQRRATELLQDATARAQRNAAELEALIESMPHGVYFGNARGITRCNQLALRMLGVSSLAELSADIGELGRKFRVTYRDDPDRLVEPEQLPFARALRGEPAVLDTWVTKVDSGEQSCVRGTSAPVFEGGRIVGAVAVNTDITEQVRAEAALRVARDEAEVANRAKDKFLAVLSHELRTPLSPVVMTIPAMEMDPDLPFKFREDLAMVRRNIDLEVKLIDDLLDLSRVTSGKLRLQMQPVRAHDLLRHVARSSLGETAGKRLSVRHDLAASNDRLTADPARLQQVFWNLLRNAVKFTPEGGDIVVRTSNDREGGQLLIEVQDSGVGIPAEVLPRVFDAFEQGEQRMTRQFGGLGLGLAIAKAVVEMHGGTIRAASAGPGRGATFTVRLNTVAAGKAARLPTPDRPEAGPADAARSRVLLVEDHPDTARTLARLLVMAGYDVRATHSVASALQLAAAEPFDVIVSDIGLPDATGYELMQEVRDRYGLKGIALSGYGMEEDMRKSREAGFVEHVIKPINVAQLSAVIRRVVSGTTE